jgi:hypothetical protein
MKAEALVKKMHLREEREWLRMEQERRRKAKQPKPVSRAQANIARVVELRKKTAAIDYELETQRTLAAESKRHQDASVALYLANLTPAQRAERDEDTRRMAFHYSGLIPELSPSWREEAAAAFKNRKL